MFDYGLLFQILPGVLYNIQLIHSLSFIKSERLWIPNLICSRWLRQGSMNLTQ